MQEYNDLMHVDITVLASNIWENGQGEFKLRYASTDLMLHELASCDSQIDKWCSVL